MRRLILLVALSCVVPVLACGRAKTLNVLDSGAEIAGWEAPDCTMKNTQGPVAVKISPDNHAYDLILRNLEATGTYGKVSPVVNDGSRSFDKVTVKDVTVSR